MTTEGGDLAGRTDAAQAFRGVGLTVTLEAHRLERRVRMHRRLARLILEPHGTGFRAIRPQGRLTDLTGTRPIADVDRRGVDVEVAAGEDFGFQGLEQRLDQPIQLRHQRHLADPRQLHPDSRQLLFDPVIGQMFAVMGRRKVCHHTRMDAGPRQDVRRPRRVDRRRLGRADEHDPLVDLHVILRRAAGEHLDALDETGRHDLAAHRADQLLQIRRGHLDYLPRQRGVQRLRPFRRARLAFAGDLRRRCRRARGRRRRLFKQSPLGGVGRR